MKIEEPTRDNLIHAARDVLAEADSLRFYIRTYAETNPDVVNNYAAGGNNERSMGVCDRLRSLLDETQRFPCTRCGGDMGSHGWLLSGQDSVCGPCRREDA